MMPSSWVIRISPRRFLARHCRRQLNQGVVVLFLKSFLTIFVFQVQVYFSFFAFSYQYQCAPLPGKTSLRNDPAMCRVGHYTLLTQVNHHHVQPVDGYLVIVSKEK